MGRGENGIWKERELFFEKISTIFYRNNNLMRLNKQDKGTTTGQFYPFWGLICGGYEN
jgi:hypothetical protein